MWRSNKSWGSRGRRKSHGGANIATTSMSPHSLRTNELQDRIKVVQDIIIAHSNHPIARRFDLLLAEGVLLFGDDVRFAINLDDEPR